MKRIIKYLTLPISLMLLPGLTLMNTYAGQQNASQATIVVAHNGHHQGGMHDGGKWQGSGKWQGHDKKWQGHGKGWDKKWSHHGKHKKWSHHGKYCKWYKHYKWVCYHKGGCYWKHGKKFCGSCYWHHGKKICFKKKCGWYPVKYYKCWSH